MKFCPQCGTPFEPEARFCLECGFDRTTFETVEPPLINTPDVIVTETPAITVNPSEIPSSQPKTEPVCPECGAILTSGDRFCLHCGFDTARIKLLEPLISQPTKAAEVEEVIVPVHQISPAESKQFCSQCGTTIASGDRFCPECGFDTTTGKSASEANFKPLDQPEAIYESAHVPPAPDSKTIVQPPPPQAVRTPATAYTPNRAPESGNQQKSRKSWIWIALLIIGIGALGVAGWFGYTKYYNTSEDEFSDTTTSMGIPEIPTYDTNLPETEVTEPDEESTPEQPKATSKPLSRIDQELAKQKEKSKTAQQTSTSAQKSKPDPGEKESPNMTGNDNMSKIILEVGRKEEPKSKKPKNPTKLMLQKPTMIVRITTDHYNDGMGTSGGGTISIKDRDGNVMGTFRAKGRTGKNSAPNAKWVAEPNRMLEKGTYFIWDSDMSTWSKNFVGTGFVVVEGYEVE